MAAKTQQQQAPQTPPGAYFRYPGVGARPRIVQETGPCAPATSTTLSATTQTSAPFQKFQTLDIDEGFLLELDFANSVNQGTATLTPSVLFPSNLVNTIQVQFESAYNTFRLPGWLAYAMQTYRSLFAPRAFPEFQQNGAGATPPSSYGANIYSATNPLGATPNLAENVTGTAQNFSLFYEVPVSMIFDLYWELSANGQPMGAPIPRAIVSPQRMAATTRNVTPSLTYNAISGLNSELLFPATTATLTGVGAITSTVTQSWFRKAFIPTDNPLTEPPGRFWQYSRDFISFQPAGASIPAIPIDDSVPGQGQILSMVFATYDPALNGGLGGFTPYSSYNLVELLYGSNVQIYQQTPKANLWQWQQQHEAFLPTNLGMMGWDMMLTSDGRLTNENAINTLVVNGTQLRITYGTPPSNNATIFIGLEMLKKVGS